MINNIDDEKKADILLSALEERYDSIHKIRERVESTGIWFLGIMLGVSGWLLQADVSLTCDQKIIYILAAVVAFVAVRYFYLEDLCTGFRGQQRMAAKIEKALGFFMPGFFDGSSEPMYPEKWEKAGTADGDGKFFRTTYILIYVGVVFLILTILLSGHFTEANPFVYYQYSGF